MDKPSERLINLFGALALGVSDRMRKAALAGDTGHAMGGETAAALVVIGHAAGLSIQKLGQVLQLSHPGAVRLVDRLAAAGLAQRTHAPHDRRAVALTLTAQGETQKENLLERRRMALESVLNMVEPEDYAAFERVIGQMLGALPDDATSALNICRLCNEHKCADCPMEIFGSIDSD